MAFSFEVTIASGSTPNVNVPFGYISKSDVHVSLDGVQVDDATLTWLSGSQIQLPSTPASGVSVKVYRNTPANSINTQFSNPDVMDAADVNSGLQQLLYVVQEAFDVGNANATDLTSITDYVNSAMAAANDSAEAAAASAATADEDRVAAVAAAAEATAAGSSNFATTPEALGAVGNGAANDTAPLVAALADARPVYGHRNSTYYTSGVITPGSDFYFDLNGGTWKPTATAAQVPSDGVIQKYAAFGGTATVTDQVENRVYVIVDAIPADWATGDTIVFFATSLSGRWPVCMRKITSIDPTTKVVAFAFGTPGVWGGTITAKKITLNKRFIVRNGTIDCSGIDPSIAEVFNISGYEEVIFENVRWVNVNLSQAQTNYLANATYSRKVLFTENREEDLNIGGNGVSVANCSYAEISGNRFSGDGFGMAVSNTDDFLMQGNFLIGRKHSGGINSIRGFKSIGCLRGVISGNTIVDFDSGIKLEDVANHEVIGNNISSCEVSINASNQNPDARNGRHLITGNTIRDNRNTSGAICVGDGLMEAVSVRGNRIEKSWGSAIANIGSKDCEVSDNYIYGWSIGAAGTYYAVRHEADDNNGGTLPTGALKGNSCRSDIGTNKGFYIEPTATGVTIGNDNTTNTSVVFGARPTPPASDQSWGVRLLGVANVDMNSTADQQITLSPAPSGSVYRFLSILAYGASASAAAAVGGLYTDASKGGTAIVANTQAYTSLTGPGTNQVLGITNAGVQVMTDTSLFFSLSTPQGAACTAKIAVLGYLIPLTLN